MFRMNVNVHYMGRDEKIEKGAPEMRMIYTL
jgi:hypothetical protein